jgi:hypothetical protein
MRDLFSMPKRLGKRILSVSVKIELLRFIYYFIANGGAKRIPYNKRSKRQFAQRLCGIRLSDLLPPRESVRRQPDSEDGESVESRHLSLLSIISIMARFKRPALQLIYVICHFLA